MIRKDVPYLTKVSRPPYPFISTGNHWKSATDEKTTFFRELSVALPVIGVATRPKDIKCMFDIVRAPEIVFWGTFIDGFAVGLGMMLAYFGITWLIFALFCAFLAWNTRKTIEIAAFTLRNDIESLNEALGEAILMVKEGGMNGQSPIAGILTEILRQNLEPQVEKPKVIQAADGKFTKNEDTSS